jgi:lon-related putative ATP-dependent protease
MDTPVPSIANVSKDSPFELSAEDVAFTIDAAQGEATLHAASPEWGSAIIGQARALEALRMGVRIRAKGYNVHVSGAPGTGRRTAVLRVLAGEPSSSVGLRDIVYVYNFSAALEPIALELPAGTGGEFKRDLHRMIEALKHVIRLHEESPATRQDAKKGLQEFEERENALLASFESELLADGFMPIQVEEDGNAAMDIVPLLSQRGSDGNSAKGKGGQSSEKEGGEDKESKESRKKWGQSSGRADQRGQSVDGWYDGGSTAGFAALQGKVAEGELSQAAYDDIRRRWYGHMDKMRELFDQLRRDRIALERRNTERFSETFMPQVEAEAALLAEKWPDPKVHAWVSSLGKDIMDHLYLFTGEGKSVPRRRRNAALSRYGVNLLVDHEGQSRAPIIFENHPTVANLFGVVEPTPGDEGDTRTAYLRIRAGAFLRAAGGFLVLRAEDVLADEEAWLRLKRALQDGFVEVQGRDVPFGSSGWLKPEPIKAVVKVIMIGGEASYDVLYQADPDFQKLFKIHAEFDSSMRRDSDALRDYAAFARRISTDEGLLPLVGDGLSALLEYGSRLAEYRTKLSTRFGMIADLLRESDYHARQAGGSSIAAANVRAAVETRTRLSNLPEEKLEEMIASGEIILQAEGLAVGRVNGLAVHDRGYFAFGMPAVISAQVSPGEGGVINIEGESGLSGEIYNKAVLIVEGFLRSHYARDFPLAVTAGICFEQSYTAVEGDSASSTAVYALLSAIAGIPLRQDIAVTGSLNQLGQVQPVGGVNEKIEGFYRVCRQVGLSGTQGVMIPRRNIVNLTLSQDVRTAIAEGRFHVWAVSTIDEGIAVLTGMVSGIADTRGDFPPDSFNGRVRRELLRMARTVKSYTG